MMNGKGRKQSLLLFERQENVSALYLTWETMPRMFSTPGRLVLKSNTWAQPPSFSFLWYSTWSASAFGLSTPALRQVMDLSMPSLHWVTEETATDGMHQLCKEHGRSHRNFHSALYPSIRIYYLLTRKPHKGLKCFFLKQTLWARLWALLHFFTVSKPFCSASCRPKAQGTDFCPAEQSFHLGWSISGKGPTTQEKSL